jgi:hypothetical protein
MVQLVPPELLGHQPRSAVAQVVEGRHAAQGGGQHRTPAIAGCLSVIIQLVNLHICTDNSAS